MKTLEFSARFSRAVMALLVMAGGWAGERAARAQDFTVTTPGGAFNYTINGVSGNPALVLVRGRTYTFSVNTSFNHPFEIAGTTGVVNNNITFGTITYTVPVNATTHSYRCSIHLFGGSISASDPPVPSLQLTGYSFGSNITLQAVASNVTAIVPEFSTNLSLTNWSALTVQSNVVNGVTNDIFCGRPSGPNLFIRLRATSN